MKNIKLERFEQIIDGMAGKKVAVIGDIMLDRYFWGEVTRVSPEAPVPVVDITSEDFHLGGAANVASNLKSLGLDTYLCGVLGDDNSGSTFKELTEARKINSEGLIEEDGRPTTVKTRVFGNNQQIVRLDREEKIPIQESTISRIIEFIKSIEDLKAIVFEDYDKGMLTPTLIKSIQSYAQENGILTFVDPKFKHFFEYSGATVFKPNKKEAETALGRPFKGTEEVKRAGVELKNKLQVKNLLITLGADGMMLFDEKMGISSVKTIARTVADVSGAGDTAIATMAASMVGGAEVGEAAMLANLASGTVCEQPGIVSIDYIKLKSALKKNR
ncbi:MAG: D-glycero-beta-D-manno-heptose-7-phosphate kinase [Candidatus Kapaibacteriales bacterium]